MRTNPLRIPIALAALALLGAGCFSDHSRNNEFGDAVATARFSLVIEADRTGVDATHFLVDQATGDLWRLDVSGRAQGAWVRLASGPEDVREPEWLADLARDVDAPEDD